MIEIGLAVHSKRREMGLTQAELAKRSGLSRATISALENGMLAELGINRLLALLETLGLTLQITPDPNRRPTLDELYERQNTLRMARETEPYRG